MVLNLNEEELVGMVKQNHDGTITVSGGGETVTFQARMYKERNGK